MSTPTHADGGGGAPQNWRQFSPEMKNRVMQEPPVAQGKERIPPVLHLLCSAGESLAQVSSSTSSSPFHLLFSSSNSSPSSFLFLFTSSSSSSSPPSLPPIVSSSSWLPPPPPFPPLCLKLGNAHLPSLPSLSFNAHSVFPSAANQSAPMGFCSRPSSAVSCQSQTILRAAATTVTQQVCG